MSDREELVVSLIGAMIGLARSTEGNVNRPAGTTHNALLSAMYCALPGMAVAERQMEDQIRTLHREKERLVPRCTDCEKACGRNDDFDLYLLGELEPELTAAKDALLFGLLALEPLLRGYPQDDSYSEVMEFLYKGFFFVGYECEKDQIILVLAELEKMRTNLLQTKYAINQTNGECI